LPIHQSSKRGEISCDKKDVVLLNRKERSAKVPGVLGARLCSGTGKSPFLMGVGDCILLDFSKWFFAVGDSPEWNTSSSRVFMIKFDRMLADCLDNSSDCVYSQQEWADLKDVIVQHTHMLLESILFEVNCTFTGILIANTDLGREGIVFHTGDSLLYQCNNKTGKSSLVTQSNFWMIGKTKQLYQVDTMVIEESTRLLIATDGLSDIDVTDGVDRNEFIGNLFQENAVENIPCVLLDRGRLKQGYVDDVGIITINPNELYSDDKIVVIGGTTSNVEQMFQERVANEYYQDNYISLKNESGLIIVI